MDYKRKLEFKTSEYMEKFREAGIPAFLSGSGQYYIEISVPERIKIYSNKKGELKLVLPNDVTEKRKEIIVKLWEETNGRLHNGIHIYADGSYKDGVVGFGFVVVENNKVLYSYSGSLNDPEASRLRNVSGEIAAVIKAMEFCEQNKISELTIHYDYKGLEDWATGKWRAKTPFTMKYVDSIKEYMKKIKIEWVKVESHTGVYFNEVVDKLAKAGTEKSKI